MSLPKVLVTVHQSLVAHIREAAAESGADVECAATLADMSGALFDRTYAAVIVQMQSGAPEANVQHIRALVMAAQHAPLLLLMDKEDFQLTRDALRTGVADVLTVPEEISELPRALKLLLEQAAQAIDAAPRSGVRAKGRVFAVYSAKGGAGTTLLSTNLALGMTSVTQGPIALLDLGLQFGGVEGVLNLTPERSFVDLVPVLSELNEVHLRNVSLTHPTGLSIFCSPAKLNAIRVFGHDQTQALLQGMRSFFTQIVIDCPSAMVPTTEAALKIADHVLYVVTPDSPSLRRLRIVMDQWEQSKAVDRKRVHLVLNRISSHSEIEAKDVADITGLPILGHVRASFAAIQPLLNVGQPLISETKAVNDLPVARDLRNLAHRVAKL